MLLSIVIPFYNEAENARRVVGELINSLTEASTDFELILVDNGSTDGSFHILEEFAQKNPNRIKVVSVPINEGYGWGIITGLKNASGVYVGFMCGDGQIKPEDVITVYHQIERQSCDLAKVRRASREYGIWRRTISFAYNCFFRAMFRVSSRDINVSPKIFHKDWMDAFQLTAKDWFIDAEIIIKAKYLNLKIAEVPVTPLPRKKGKSHVGFATIWEFTANMLNYKFGKEINEWKQKALK